MAGPKTAGLEKPATLLPEPSPLLPRPLSLELAAEFPPNRNSYEHAEARLLGEQRPEPGDSLLVAGGRSDATELRFVRLVEPPALLEGLTEDALELGDVAGDALLRSAKALRLRERGERRLDLGLGRFVPARHDSGGAGPDRLSGVAS